METRTIQNMCEACHLHNSPVCGWEKRNHQHECKYNAYINAGYKLAQKDLSLGWKDIKLIGELINKTLKRIKPNTPENKIFTRVLIYFNRNRFK